MQHLVAKSKTTFQRIRSFSLTYRLQIPSKIYENRSELLKKGEAELPKKGGELCKICHYQGGVPERGVIILEEGGGSEPCLHYDTRYTAFVCHFCCKN